MDICNYPDCNCPFDMGPDNKCLRGYPSKAEAKAKKKKAWEKAVAAAKEILIKGDRIRVSRCGGIVATYTFDHWDGNWIVSRSGIDDLAVTSISKLNGQPIKF